MYGLSLASQNPWWLDRGRINVDEHVRRVEESPVKWIPSILGDIDLSSDSIYTLRGPRQVGKTTAIKLMIRRLLEDHVDPRRVFYWTCDLIASPAELAGLLDAFIDQTRRISEDRLFIFLDEVSSVRDWQKGIKYLFDTGRLRGCTLIVTGSHSLDLKRSAERLPGRRGDTSKPLDKTLLPMKFSEFVEARDTELGRLVAKYRLIRANGSSELFDALTSGEIPAGVGELNLHSTRLVRLLDEYLITGGIISVVNDYVVHGKVDQGLYQKYLSAVIGDVARWGKKEIYLAALLRRIDETTSSRVSWTALKRGTDISHTDTVADYIDVMESSFILLVLYNLDEGSGEPKLEKEKKIYFRDPFIYHTLAGWVHQEPPFEHALKTSEESKSKLVESVVCDHLARLSYDLHPTDSFEPRRSIFYWAEKAREVDFVVKGPDYLVPFEVKYQNTINRSDFNGLIGFPLPKDKSGILVTKQTLDLHRGTVAIPAHIFLALI